MRRSSFIALLLCAALIGPGPFITTASARLASSDGIGGPGGGPYRLDCGESGLLIGVSGRSGDVIDQIAGVCIKIDPISGVWVGGSYETAHYGGGGGAPFSKRCPVGQALWGFDGSEKNFKGSLVVGSIDIKCIDIDVQALRTGAWIEGTRLISYYGDPDPDKIQAFQDYCDQPDVGTNVHREPRVWNPVGVALEGRAGDFVDRVHIICGSIPADTKGYRVQFTPSSNITVPEGTPLHISWRASGVKPELTPGLDYQWVLNDLTHTYSSILGSQPTTIQNACAYALQPCGSGWFSSSSFSSATFISLPAAEYELKLSVRPTSGTPFSYHDSGASVRFEIRPNLLVSLTLSPDSVRAGTPTTGTVTMEGPAPPKGRVLYFSSSNPTLVPVPSSITIPAGSATGTFKLSPNSAPGSAGQLTISVSTRAPISAKVTTGVQGSVLSRGIDESSEPAQSETAEGIPEVTERGIGLSQMAKKSSGIQNAIVTPPSSASPTVTLQPSQVGAAIANLPADTKSAVITVQLPFGIQLPTK